MTTASYAPRVAAKPIKVLIIHPDDTYELRIINQDLRTMQDIVGGYIEDVQTPQAVLWVDEEGKYKDQPQNPLATYLWWNFRPEMEGHDVLSGTVFVTGLADGEDCLPVSDEVVEFFERMRSIYMEHKDD